MAILQIYLILLSNIFMKIQLQVYNIDQVRPNQASTSNQLGLAT